MDIIPLEIPIRDQLKVLSLQLSVWVAKALYTGQLWVTLTGDLNEKNRTNQQADGCCKALSKNRKAQAGQYQIRPRKQNSV